VDLAIHDVESFLEDVFYRVQIIQITENNVGGGSERLDSI
jgi:hypothetical protein